MTISIFNNPACGININCGDSFLQRLLFLFDPVWWSYPFKNFDNTGATYLTDYGLCLFMLYGAYSVIRDANPSPLRTRVVLLLLLYAISVFTGGIAHQFFQTPEGVTSLLDIRSALALNTFSFRVLWSICVGAVCAAGGVFGGIACQLGDMFPNKDIHSSSSKSKTTIYLITRHITPSMGILVGAFMGALTGGMIGGLYGSLINNTNAPLFIYATSMNPSGRSGSMISIIISSTIGIIIGIFIGMIFGYLFPKKCICFTTSIKLEKYWWLWNITFVYFTFYGFLSMIQPAADIFVAGFSQAFSTMHVAAVFIANYNCDLQPYQNRKHLVNPKYRSIFLIGLFLNMPLIIIYPLVLSYYPNLSLGFVNAGLHSCLATAWGMQWYSLKGYCIAYNDFNNLSSSSSSSTSSLKKDISLQQTYNTIEKKKYSENKKDS
mmetsp:Transcript_37640/g.48692  ORF Transcript_37640/g.48692 Transcript_37640/m.48692 type:complete len:434 (+) Transcript_37640:104-1405(+)